MTTVSDNMRGFLSVDDFEEVFEGRRIIAFNPDTWLMVLDDGRVIDFSLQSLRGEGVTPDAYYYFQQAQKVLKDTTIDSIDTHLSITPSGPRRTMTHACLTLVAHLSTGASLSFFEIHDQQFDKHQIRGIIKNILTMRAEDILARANLQLVREAREAGEAR